MNLLLVDKVGDPLHLIHRRRLVQRELLAGGIDDVAPLLPHLDIRIVGSGANPGPSCGAPCGLCAGATSHLLGRVQIGLPSPGLIWKADTILGEKFLVIDKIGGRGLAWQTVLLATDVVILRRCFEEVGQLHILVGREIRAYVGQQVELLQVGGNVRMRPEHVGRRSRCHQGNQLCLRVDSTTTCVSLNDVNGHRTLLVVEELTQGLVAGLIRRVGSLGHEYDLALGGGGCRDGSRSGLGCRNRCSRSRRRCRCCRRFRRFSLGCRSSGSRLPTAGGQDAAGAEDTRQRTPAREAGRGITQWFGH